MKRLVHEVLGLAVLLLCAAAGAGATRAAEERGALPEGWKTTVPMPDRLWGPEGRYLIWVEDGWLQVRRETSNGQTDWHIVLARATDPNPPVVKEPGRPPTGSPRFEVSYRDGRFFVREDLNVLRAVREPKPAVPAAWPAITMPSEQRGRMGWGRSAGPPPLQ